MIAVVRDKNVNIELHLKKAKIERNGPNSISITLDNGEYIGIFSHNDISVTIFEDD